MTQIESVKDVDSELLDICKEIKAQNYSFEEWMNSESCDMFQSAHYCGGFDADDQAFWFSYYDDNEKESYFRMDLSEVDEIISGNRKTIVLEKPK